MITKKIRKNIVVIGSGMTGCLTAFKIAKKYKLCNIYLIDNSKEILQSFNPIKFDNVKFNNGYHALEINRSPKLFKFLKNNLRLKFFKKKSNRFLAINKFLIKENTSINNYPTSLQNCFINKKLTSKNIVDLYYNIKNSLKKTIQITSKRYSDNINDTLHFFIPWFIPKEFNYKSNDEGDIFREKVKKKQLDNYLAVPKNGLFKLLSKAFIKQLKHLKNVKIFLNTQAKYENNEIIFINNEKKICLHYDYIFICTTPIFLLKKSKSDLLQKLTSNKKYFVCCIVKLKKKLHIKFTEIICIFSKFKEFSRFSKVNLKNNRREYLIELIFKKDSEIKNKITKSKLMKILNFLLIYNNNSLDIIDFKITRKVIFPSKKTVINCKNYLKLLLRKMNVKKNRFFCTFNFGPINMTKSWIESEKNLNTIKNELSR